MDMQMGFIRQNPLAVWTTLTLLLAPGVGTTDVKAQVVEPIFPLPGSTHAVSSQPIELKLTEQPQIQTNSIQIKLNGVVLEGNLSIDTSDLSLGFQATPPNYNLGDNTLTVQFETQSGVQSQFSWPFIIETAVVETPETVPEAEAVIAPLAPAFTTQVIEGNTLTLSGQTQSGATVNLNIVANQPASSLVDLGPFSITTEPPEPRQMTSSIVADADGFFTLDFDVTGDPVQTDYQVEAIATQGDEQATSITSLQR